MTRHGGQILVESLMALGATKAFGVPGESYLAVLDALYDSRDEIRLINARHEAGAANMGDRPTVNGTENRLEVHLLDYNDAGAGKDSLYGKHLTVAFRHYVRAEEKFADLDQLKTAIWQDVQAVRDYFEKTGLFKTGL